MDTAPSTRTQLKRAPHRGQYTPEQLYSIVDSGWLCHLSIATPDGPMCIPTIYARQDDEIYVHGASKSGLLSQLRHTPFCAVISLVDGIVLARSAMHHSVNYRSVVAFGQAREVTDPQEKVEALARLVDHLIVQRSSQCRPPNPAELKATSVYALPLREASAKVRSGPPKDDKQDHELDHWAGVIPVHTRAGPAEPAPDLRPQIDAPSSVLDFQLPRNRLHARAATNNAEST